MSINRDFVIWQSADGTWSYGLYDEDGEFMEDAGVGHPTEEGARNAYRGANPGSEMVLPYNGGTRSDLYDLEALELLNPREAHRRRVAQNTERVLTQATTLEQGSRAHVAWCLDLDYPATIQHGEGVVGHDDDGDLAVRLDNGTVVALLLGDGSLNPYVQEVRPLR